MEKGPSTRSQTRMVKDKGVGYYTHITMDNTMPRMMGPEATRLIRDMGFEGLLRLFVWTMNMLWKRAGVLWKRTAPAPQRLYGYIAASSFSSTRAELPCLTVQVLYALCFVFAHRCHYWSDWKR